MTAFYVIQWTFFLFYLGRNNESWNFYSKCKIKCFTIEVTSHQFKIDNLLTNSNNCLNLTLI